MWVNVGSSLIIGGFFYFLDANILLKVVNSHDID